MNRKACRRYITEIRRDILHWQNWLNIGRRQGNLALETMANEWINKLKGEIEGIYWAMGVDHDRQWSNAKWMENGFAFACDGMKFRQCWLTHEPSTSLADGCILNIHGHLHNIWHGFQANKEDLPAVKLRHPWQRLFAIEYTDYRPVEFDKFVTHPKKYLSTGLGD